jgi:hypothetical protein
MTSFTQDLFISDAHIDNQAMTADEQGLFNRFNLCWHFNFDRALPDGDI